MDDNVHWKVRVSKALLQTHCMYRQAIVARGAAEGIVNLMGTGELIERKIAQKWGPSPLPSLNVPCFNMQMGGQW